MQRLLANAALASFDMQRVVHRMTVDAAKGLQGVRKPMLQIYGKRHPSGSMTTWQGSSRRLGRGMSRRNALS
ncbi:hypothetical protein [Rhizobacter sp. Root29]|uniref:hypothetical protein n=1 Tax=unclassified Rhizobacter TaxID=2640088 RepID=UPI0035172FBB